MGGMGFNPFGDMGSGGGSSRRRRKPQVTRTPDIEHVMEVSLEEMYTGATRKIEFNQRVVCQPCNGQGTKSASVKTKCTTCNGTGVETKVVRFGPGMMGQTQQECSACGGEGEVIQPHDRCPSCKGQKVVSHPKRLDINIEPVRCPLMNDVSPLLNRVGGSGQRAVCSAWGSSRTPWRDNG